jgi:uncharacterized protein
MNFLMTYHLENNKTLIMKIQLKYILAAFVLFTFLSATGQEGDFPERPKPPKIVNDFAGILSPAEQQQLEQKLVKFGRETSSQIAIVTLNDLRGYAIDDYAFRLGERWGIGMKEKDNGILILVSPEKRKVTIATGYGLEGAVPDATAQQIIDNEIAPNFKKGNYYKGLDEATAVLFDLTRGEYTAQDYRKKVGGGKKSKAPYPIGIVFLLVIIVAVVSRIRRARHYSMGHGVPFLVALTMLGGASNRQSGAFGNFSSGSGDFGGMGGGGFGGFGGGSFGGGGATGGW